MSFSRLVGRSFGLAVALLPLVVSAQDAAPTSEPGLEANPPVAPASTAPVDLPSSAAPATAPEMTTGEPSRAPATEVLGATAVVPEPSNISEARARIERGEALFEESNFDAALAEFEKAYELLEGYRSRPELLHNMALCHERRFRYARAMELYARYLQEAGSGGEALAEVQSTIRVLEGLLGMVDVQSSVHADIWLDDNLVGTAPGRVLIPTGMHIIELRASGYESEQRELRVVAREQVSVNFELKRIDPGLRPVWFYSGLSATLVSALIGGGFATKLMVTTGDLADSGERVAYNTKVDQEKVDDLALKADIFFIGAGVFAVATTVVALFTEFKREPAPQTGEPRLALLVSPFSLGLEGSY